MQPQALMKERTNFVHNIHIVNVVSLPQVEGQLLGQEKEGSISPLSFSSFSLLLHTIYSPVFSASI